MQWYQLSCVPVLIHRSVCKQDTAETQGGFHNVTVLVLPVKLV